MTTDEITTTNRTMRGVMDLDTCNDLDDFLRQIEHLLNAISLLEEAETTPPDVLSGLAYTGGAVVKLALERVRAVRIVSAETEYTANAPAH